MLVAALAFIVVVVLLIPLRSSSPTTGYDVSYPQCSGSYPSNPLFGIVGVNGGLANNANPCIGGELHWARNAPGQKLPKQPPLSLYIDTGNSGGHHLGDWPSGGTAPAYGSCNGLLTNACSYIFGKQRAAHSYRLVAALDPVAAKTAPWWLDVELTLSWAGTYQLNIAALQGYIAGLHNAGATGPIGIYSTSAQWKDITGLTPQTTPTAFNGQLPDWVAGTETTLIWSVACQLRSVVPPRGLRGSIGGESASAVVDVCVATHMRGLVPHDRVCEMRSGAVVSRRA